jgi:hypothetical protein
MKIDTKLWAGSFHYHAVLAALALLAEDVFVKIAPVSEITLLFGPRQGRIIGPEVAVHAIFGQVVLIHMIKLVR